ncbi:MAG: heavy-metal-associated domain-containing protein [Formosimonas sp.]
MNQTFPVAGMTCQHCVSRVQTLLSSVAGVRSVVVDLMPPRAHVEGDDVDWAALAAALVGTSFELKPAVVAKKVVR